MDTSATIACDLMMQMLASGAPPVGRYPSHPPLAADDVVKIWWESMGMSYIAFLDQPAVDHTFFPSGPVVDPIHTGVTLAYWSFACAKGAVTPDQIHDAVAADPYLIPTSVCNLTSTAFESAWRNEISPQLAPDNLSPSDDPWSAWGVPGAQPQ